LSLPPDGSSHQTPVLGKPWEIPMEFPTYQIVTAWIVKGFGTSLDQTGRFVSMLFFYLSVGGIFLFSKLWATEKSTRWLVPAVIVSSPLYMFWSRTFMIESTALFFSLASVGFAYVALQHKKRSTILIAIVFAVLAGLTKITTFFVAGVFVASLVALESKNRIRNLGVLAMMLLPGLMAGVLWNHHADMVKAANPLAENILSHNLKQFNFGTLAQRLTLRTWDSYLMHLSRVISYPWNVQFFGRKIPQDALYWVRVLFLVLSQVSMVFMACKALLSKRFRHPAIACLIAFASGPLVFANLYLQHEYYFYANAMYLLLVVAFGMIETYDRNPRMVVMVMLVLFVLRFDAYTLSYKRTIDSSQQLNFESIFNSIQQRTKPSDVIMIFGDRWSSVIPYYSQRKAMMVSQNLIHEPMFAKSLELVGADNIGAVVICPQWLPETDIDKIKEFNTQHNFNQFDGPFLPIGCSVFYRTSESNS
jgi:hypothetical protein